MITEKVFEDGDLSLLLQNTNSSSIDEQTLRDFANTPRTATTTFGDDDGPLILVRGSKSLRLNFAIPILPDMRRAALLLIGAISRVIERARENGFTELLIECEDSQLRHIAVKDFGFTEFGDGLRKHL